MIQIHNSPPKGYGCGLGSRDYKRIAIGQAETIKKLEKKIVDDKAWYDLGLKLLQNKYKDRISDLERQLCEATQWRSPETAPKDGTRFIGYYDTDKILGTRADTIRAKDDPYTWLTNEGFLVKHKTLVGWIPLPEKKEDV